MQKSSIKYWQTKFNSISKRIMCDNQFGFILGMQGWFNTCKSLIVIQHIYRSKDKTHIIILIDAEKAFYKIQYTFIVKALMKLGIKEMYLNIINDIYEKHIANIILHGEKLKTLCLKSRIRQGCPLSPLSFNIVLEFLDIAIKQKEMQIGKEVIKIPLFADIRILYIKNPKNS
jgi:hypothetical protein